MQECIYSRNGMIYIQAKRDRRRIRLSTSLKHNDSSFEFVKTHFALFLSNKTRALQEFYRLYHPQNTSQNLSLKSLTLENENEFESLIKAFLKEKQTLKYNTKYSYKSNCKDILDFLNFKKLKKLKDFKRQDSLDFIAYLQAKNNQVSTIKLKITLFKSLFKYALELDLINKNPFFTPKLNKNELELENEEKKPFDLNTIQSLIKSSKGELKSYLTVAFFTGLRTGELLGLKRDDLNLSERKAHIKRTMLDNQTTNSPKTRSSYRSIDLLPIVAQELQIISKEATETGFLFKKSRKKLRSEFNKLQEKLGIKPHRRLYDTRHSFASVMLSKGEEPMWISRVMLGHSSLNQTFKTYAKYLPKSVEERATFLNSMEF